MTQPDVQHLMLIGAYRDNEVNSAHPLMRKLEAIRKAGAVVHEIILAPLAREDLGRLIARFSSLRTGTRRRAGRTDPREDGGQSIFRHSVDFCTCRGGFAHIRSWRRAMVLGPESHSRQGLHRQCRGPYGRQVEPPAGRNAERTTSYLACMGNSAEFARWRWFRSSRTRKCMAELWEAVRAGLIFRSEELLQVCPRPGPGSSLFT